MSLLDLHPCKFSFDLLDRWLFMAVLSYFWSWALTIIAGWSFSTLFITSIVGCGAAVILLDRMRVSATGKAVLITGCDTGFGNAAAMELHRMGFTVLATCLDPDSSGASALSTDFPGGRMHVIKMDVSCNKDVEHAMEQIKSILEEGACELWSVITNAGLSTFGHVEWAQLETYEKIMSVNFIGTVRTVRAALPLIRKCRGRIITVASMLGRFGAPSRSSYASTKYAVEGFTECLRLEMREWGVGVICIEPGNFVAATSIFSGNAVKEQGERLWSGCPAFVRNEYGKEAFDRVINEMSNYTASGERSTSPVVSAICDAVSHSHPRTRYQVLSLREKLRCFISTHLPSPVFDYFYG